MVSWQRGSERGLPPLTAIRSIARPLPTTTTTVLAVKDAAATPQALSPENTVFANYYGLPAIGIPCGFDSNGLCLGLQTVGKPCGETTLLYLAHRQETAAVPCDVVWSSRKMSQFIAFLRAINAGPRRAVKMEFLRRVFESLHFSEVTTFIGSGNVVLRAGPKNARVLERSIEKGLRHALGYEVTAFVRTDTELAQIVNCRQFRLSEADGRDFNIIFLSDPLGERLRREVMALRTDTDEFCVQGREIYWLRRKKQGGVGFSNVPLEKTLGRKITVRGAKTVKKIALRYVFNV